MAVLPQILTTLFGEGELSPTKRRVMLGVSLASLAAGSWFHSPIGLGLVRVDVIQPAAAWSSELKGSTATLTPREDYVAEYLAAFSRHYFGHAGSGYEAVSEKDLAIKVVARNRSHGSGQTLSTIDAVVTAIEAAPFPWDRLDVSAKVEARNLRLVPTGIGPVIDLSWKWSGESLTLSEGSGALLGPQHPGIDLRAGIRTAGSESGGTEPPNGEVVQMIAMGGKLLRPVFVRVPEGEAGAFEVGPPPPPELTDPTDAGPVDAPVSECSPPDPAHYGWYAELRTVEALRRHTVVVFEEPLTVRAQWSDIDGVAGSFESKSPSPSGVAFWKSTPQLLEWDPRCRGGLMSVDGAGFGSPGDFLGSAGEALLTEVPPGPGGVDIHSVRLAVPVQGLRLGGRAVAAEATEVILNPRGLLFATIDLTGIQAMRYRVDLSVEGTTLARFEIAPLVPEFESFENEGPMEAIERLRALRASRNRTAATPAPP